MDTQSLVAGRPDDLNFEKKTASASESLAHNLAANAADGEETVHGGRMVQRRQSVKSREKAFFGKETNSAIGLIILDVFGLTDGGGPFASPDRALSQPRKRRDAAERSGYGKTAAASGAPVLTFVSCRGGPSFERRNQAAVSS